MNLTLNVLDIMPGTTVDGPGLRTSIYFAGCAHHCKGCHNPQSWDFNAGEAMSIDEILAEVERHGFNVTFSGGDPLFQVDGLTILAKRLKNLGYNIWCYTGFLYENIMHKPEVTELLKYVDVLVDGPFIESERDISLHFRGSHNQRLIDLRRSSPDNIVLFTPNVTPNF